MLPFLKRFGFFRPRLMLAMGLLAPALIVGAAARAELPDPIRFYAIMTAEEQSTTTVSSGVGRADFFLERATQRFSWSVTFEGLTSRVVGAAVHGPQRPGTNAGVLFELAPQASLGALPLQGAVVLTDAQIEYLLSGRMYVNVRSARYPEGELRGQIERMPP